VSKKKDRKAQRLLEREMRREARQYLRDNPAATTDDIKSHLSDEYGGLGIDPLTIMAIINLIIEFFALLTNRDP